MTRLPATNGALHEKHLLTLGLTILHLLIAQVVDDLLRLLRNSGIVRKITRGHIAEVFAIADYLFVAHGDIARGLVGHMHVVMLVAQTTQGAAHRDHVVVGMRTKHNHLLRIGQSALRTTGVVGIRFASRPARNRVLDIVEDLDVHIIG